MLIYIFIYLIQLYIINIRYIIIIILLSNNILYIVYTYDFYNTKYLNYFFSPIYWIYDHLKDKKN